MTSDSKGSFSLLAFLSLVFHEHCSSFGELSRTAPDNLRCSFHIAWSVFAGLCVLTYYAGLSEDNSWITWCDGPTIFVLVRYHPQQIGVIDVIVLFSRSSRKTPRARCLAESHRETSSCYAKISLTTRGSSTPVRRSFRPFRSKIRSS